MKFKFFILINLLVIMGVVFVPTASAQLSQKPYDHTFALKFFDTKQQVKIPSNPAHILEFDSCFGFDLSFSPNFTGVAGLEEKIPEGIKVGILWGPDDSTYLNETTMQQWSYTEVKDKVKKFFYFSELDPNTIYSAVYVMEMPISKAPDRVVKMRYSYPKFFKTGISFQCQTEAEMKYFEELSDLAQVAFYSKKLKGIIYNATQDSEAIPLRFIKPGERLSIESGTCKIGMIMAKNGALMCSNVVDKFNAMVDAFEKENPGFELKSGAIGGLRDTETVKQMRVNRGCKNNINNDGCRSTIGLPEKSNHRHGEAADFACYKNGKFAGAFKYSFCYQWLIKNKAINYTKYGFLPYGAGDEMHVSTTGR